MTEATRMPSARRKLPARYLHIVMPLVLSFLMTSIVSAISTLRAVGFVDDILWRWVTAWALSWIVAFPALLVLLPITRRIVGAVVEAPRG